MIFIIFICVLYLYFNLIVENLSFVFFLLPLRLELKTERRHQSQKVHTYVDFYYPSPLNLRSYLLHNDLRLL